jgi:tetratricopeptide (TPR) repeat protein
MASYLIRYADGSQAEVPLIAKINLMDWQGRYGDEISPEETDTFTRSAGSVPVKASPCGQASVFVMQWINPEPAKSVTEIVFVSKRQGVPVLMGLTLGVDPAPVDTTPGDRAAAEALRLAVKDMEPAAAVAQLQKALAADPSYDAVRLDLAAAQVKAGDAEGAERTLRAALRARVELLQGYADLAQLLEGQSRWIEAAEVWRRSLAANPNQPAVYHALENANRKAKE